jgi:hypothetical protein
MAQDVQPRSEERRPSIRQLVQKGGRFSAPSFRKDLFIFFSLRRSFATWRVADCVGPKQGELENFVLADTYERDACVGICVDECVDLCVTLQAAQKPPNAGFAPAPPRRHETRRMSKLTPLESNADAAYRFLAGLVSGFRHQPQPRFPLCEIFVSEDRMVEDAAINAKGAAPTHGGLLV